MLLHLSPRYNLYVFVKNTVNVTFRTYGSATLLYLIQWLFVSLAALWTNPVESDTFCLEVILDQCFCFLAHGCSIPQGGMNVKRKKREKKESATSELNWATHFIRIRSTNRYMMAVMGLEGFEPPTERFSFVSVSWLAGLSLYPQHYLLRVRDASAVIKRTLPLR